MMSKKQIRGQQAEHYARTLLSRQGLHFIEANFQCRFGEIDLIMLEPHSHTVCFIEVRSRTNPDYGNAIESVLISKQQKIIRAAHFYVQYCPQFQNHYLRFDIFGLTKTREGEWENQWLKGAFDAEEFW